VSAKAVQRGLETRNGAFTRYVLGDYVHSALNCKHALKTRLGYTVTTLVYTGYEPSYTVLYTVTNSTSTKFIPASDQQTFCLSVYSIMFYSMLWLPVPDKVDHTTHTPSAVQCVQTLQPAVVRRTHILK